MGLRSSAFVVGFVVFLVVLVLGLLVGALHSINNAQSINQAAETDLLPEPQSFPTLSVEAAFASVIVFFSGLKLFFKKALTNNGFCYMPIVIKKKCSYLYEEHFEDSFIW